MMEGRDITGQGVIHAIEENKDAGILKGLEDTVIVATFRYGQRGHPLLRRIF